MRILIKNKSTVPHLRIEQRKTRKGKRNQMVEAIVFLIIFCGIFGGLAYVMGLSNMMKTLMNTAYDLLMNTVFWLMGVTVLMGALSSVLAEFGVVQLLEKVLRPFMKPLFNLPGVAALGAVVTFLSDNPAIISLSKDNKFARYFKVYQFVSLTNFGTAFGMGLIVVMFMMSLNYFAAPLVGVFAACCGCLISTRLMQKFTLRSYPQYDAPVIPELPAPVAGPGVEAVGVEEIKVEKPQENAAVKEEERPGLFMRFLNALLTGGKNGVDLGLAIIPGVLIITTLVLLFTVDTPAGAFDGSANQGVGLLPLVIGKINFIFEWLFGFQSPDLIAVPLTALGAVGAALGLIPAFQESGILDANAVAVFTAIGMCWSGYLSTHAAMLDSMGYRKLISKAISAHTVAGLCAGVIAHWAWVLVELIIG